MLKPILFRLQDTRRSGGIAPFSPASTQPAAWTPAYYGDFRPDQVTGLQAWYDANALTGPDASSVSTITDCLGSFNATLGTGTAPILRHASQNGRKTVEFGGGTAAAQMTMSSSLLNGATQGSFFAVVKIAADPPGSTATAGGFLDGFTNDANGPTQSTHTPYSDSIFYEHFGTSARQTMGNPSTQFTTYRLYEVSVTSAGVFTNWIDGTQFYTASGQTVNFGTGTRRMFWNAAGFYIAGFLAEMPIYNQAVTQAEREKIEGYLAWKWGLVGNLPVAHPYKTVPPSAAPSSADGSGAGSPGTVTLSAPAGVGAGDGNAADSPGTVTLAAPTGIASGAANAAGSPGTVTLTAPSGTGMGSANGAADIGTVTVAAPGGVASGASSASGGIGTVTLTAPTGIAAAGGSASGAGGVGTVTLSAPTGVGSGSGNLTGSVGTVSLIAPAGAASGTASGQGSVGQVALSPAQGQASGGGSGAAGSNVVQLFPPAGTASGTAVAHPSVDTPATRRATSARDTRHAAGEVAERDVSGTSSDRSATGAQADRRIVGNLQQRRSAA